MLTIAHPYFSKRTETHVYIFHQKLIKYTVTEIKIAQILANFDNTIRPASFTTSTKPPNLRTARATELESGRIGDLRHESGDMLALVTHQDLGERLPSRAEIPVHDFQCSHFVKPAALLDLRKHVRGKLMGGVISLPLRVTEAHMPATKRKHNFAVGSRQSKDRVALVGVNVEMMGRGAIEDGVHMGSQVAEQVGGWDVRLSILVAPDGVTQIGD